MTEMGQAISRTPAQLLWTSGWDSTFRLLQLLLVHKYPVKPFYVIDPTRLSLGMEMRAIEKIKQAVLKEHPECKSLLLPVHFVLMSDIPANAEVSATIAELRQTHGIGEQYDWLARFASQMKEPLELSIERYVGRPDKWRTLLSDHVKQESGESGTYYRMVDDPAQPELKKLAVFRFPLFDRTKLDMLEAAKKHNFDHLMALTWFCHKPLKDGTACGTCAPCCSTREDGLGWRIGARGNLRDKRNTLLRKITKPFRG